MRKSELREDIKAQLRALNQSDKGKLSDEIGIAVNSLETYLTQGRRALLTINSAEAIKRALKLKSIEQVYEMHEITKPHEND